MAIATLSLCNVSKLLFKKLHSENKKTLFQKRQELLGSFFVEYECQLRFRRWVWGPWGLGVGVAGVKLGVQTF
jgi:hypothetical protein